MKKFLLIFLFAFSVSMKASSSNLTSAETLAIETFYSTLAIHGAGKLLHDRYWQFQDKVRAAGKIMPDNLTGIQDQYIANTDLGLKSGTMFNIIPDFCANEIGLITTMYSSHPQDPESFKTLSNLYVDLHATMMMPKIINVLNAQHRWNTAYHEAESITLDKVKQFHQHDLDALKNKQNLTQDNVLIQRENKLIDKLNEELFFGEKGTNSNISSKLYTLREHRNMGKSTEQLNQEDMLRNKIKKDQNVVKNKIKDIQLKNELLKPKQEALVLIHNKLPIDLTQDILTEWLPSNSSELNRLQDCQYVQKDGSYRWKNRLDILKEERLQADEEWKQLDYRNKNETWHQHKIWLNGYKSCNKKVALLKFVR